MFFERKLNYFCVFYELKRNHYFMRKRLTSHFLLYLLIYQIIFDVVNRERRTAPVIEVAL